MSDKRKIRITRTSIQEATDLNLGLTEEQVKQIATFFAEKFMEEIEQGLEGDIDYPDAPFFEAVDMMYEEAQPKGCYFCDRSIDGNETPFDYPDETRLCLSCMLKVASLREPKDVSQYNLGCDIESSDQGINWQKALYRS